MKRRNLLNLGIAVVLVIGLLVPTSVSASDELRGKPPTGFSLTSLSPRLTSPPQAREVELPFADYLSSSMWLIAKGINPLSGDLSGVERSLHEGGPQVVAPGAPVAQGGAGALVPFRDPSANFSRNILIPRDFSAAPMQTEPHLAVDPDDPDHLIVGMVDYNFPTVSTYVTFDGGVTWEGPSLLKRPREEVAAAGDPVLGFDRDGTAYITYISLDTEEFTVGNILGSATVSSMAIATSTDGGFSWSAGTPSSRSQVITQFTTDPNGRTRGTVSLGFLDKPWLDIGPNPDDPSKDIIYITYTNFLSTFSIFYTDELPFLSSPVLETVIELVKSEDGGLTWSDPVEISPRIRQVFDQGRQGDAVDQTTEVDADNPITAPGGQLIESRKRIVQGSQPAVTPDGTVYVAWVDSTDDGPFEGLGQMYVARSEDGGETFNAGRRASTFLEPSFSPRTAFFRYWGSSFAQLVTGSDGEVYVAYTGVPSGDPADDGNIYIVHSEDEGETWSSQVKINDDETSGMQFFPSISVSPDGKVHAMWGDTRDDPELDLRYHIYYAVSEDSGDSFGINSRVTDAVSNPNYGFPGGQFIGDYFSIQATEEDVYMVWADTRVGEFQGTNQKIAFARLRPMPSPSIFLSPARGPASTNVTIQGFNYQADQQLFILVGGSLVAQERTNDEGRFTTQLFFPIAGEGAQTVTVLDASGNAATASYFNEFGFDNIADIASDVAELTEALGAVVESGDLGDAVAANGDAQANPSGGCSIGGTTADMGLIALGALGLIAVNRFGRRRNGRDE